MSYTRVTADDWPDEQPITPAPLQRRDVVLDNVGKLHVIIRMCSSGEQAEVFPGDKLPDKIPNGQRGDWRNVSQLTRIDNHLWKVGAAASIDGVDGVWIVIEDDQAAGQVRVEKVFDGAGPAHLRATVTPADLRPVEANPTPADDPIDPGDPPYGVRLTVHNGEIVVPLHPAAYATPWHVRQRAEHLQHSLGLTTNAHLVQWCTPWSTDEAPRWRGAVDLPLPNVPMTLYAEVEHNHAYMDDGETPVVERCRSLSSCPTSLAIVESNAARRAGAPRFAKLDLAAIRSDAQDDAAIEYGLRYTFHEQAVESVVLTPGLAAGAYCVRLTREIQKTLGMPVDAVLIGRRAATDTTPVGNWHEVRIEPCALGEPGKLLAAP